jgi:hypothetical protein
MTAAGLPDVAAADSSPFLRPVWIRELQTNNRLDLLLSFCFTIQPQTQAAKNKKGGKRKNKIFPVSPSFLSTGNLP